MSQHFQPWKMPLPVPTALPGVLSSPSSSSTSSSSASAPYSGAVIKKEIGIGAEDHHQGFDIYSQSGLQRFASMYKMHPADLSPNNNSQPAKDHRELNLKMQQLVESNIGDFAKKQILQILDNISLLKPPERILLYMRMPGANCETDPLRQPQNPLGARSEINHTINWVRSHLEPDPNVSIPKKDVYEDYIAFCSRSSIKPLSTADFGKVMKQVFPSVRPRRLGTRGHSRYCYAAMRKATKLDPPQLPDLTSSRTDKMLFPNSLYNGNAAASSVSPGVDQDSWVVIQKWAEDLLNKKFYCASDLATHILKYNLCGSTKDQHQQKGKAKERKREAAEKVKQQIQKKRRSKKKRKNTFSSDEDEDDDSIDEPLASLIKSERHDETSDDNRIVDLKVHGRSVRCDKPTSSQEEGGGFGETKTGLAPRHNIKLMVNDEPLEEQPKPIDNSTTAIQREQVQQIENILCKKVRQAQQAKGLWTQQQQQQIQSQQAAPNSVIVSPYELKPHNFSQPDIASSPSLLNSSLRSAGHNLRERKLAKQEGAKETTEDTLAVDFIIPRERVISICNMDKDALDDYLQVAGDNSQEAEIMQYFDEASSNTPSTVDTGNNTPKMAFPTDLSVIPNSQTLDQYQLFPDQQKAEEEPPKTLINSQVTIKNEQETNDQIGQLRQYLQQNLQPQNHIMNLKTNLNPQLNVDQSSLPIGYPGSAAASLTMLSQRHNNYQIGTSVGMDLTQEAQMHTSNQMMIAQKRKIETMQPDLDRIPQRRRDCAFVPITAPISPQDSNPRLSRNEETSQYNNFVSPKNTSGFRKMQPGGGIVKPTFSQGPKQLNVPGQLLQQQQLQQQQQQQQTAATLVPQSAIFPLNEQQPRKTAFSKPMTSSHQQQQQQQIGVVAPKMAGSSSIEVLSAPQSPLMVSGDAGYGLRALQPCSSSFNSNSSNNNNNNGSSVNTSGSSSNGNSAGVYNNNNNNNGQVGKMMTPGYENRSQSVPLNYRNSPIMINPSHVMPTGNYNNNNSTCSSMAQTPIPPDYNDFTEMIEIWNMAPSEQSDSLLSSSTTQSQLIDSPGGQPQIHSTNSNGQRCEENGSKFKDSNNNEEFLAATNEIKSSFGSIISRSVPSTPVPMGSASYYPRYNGNGSNDQSFGVYTSNSMNRRGFLDVSKSVPTTPISNTANPFRYSPIADPACNTRDFLINGRALLEPNKMNFYPNSENSENVQSQSKIGNGFGGGETKINDLQSGSSSSNSIMDKDFSPLTDTIPFDDPIMGSDLINNFKPEF